MCVGSCGHRDGSSSCALVWGGVVCFLGTLWEVVRAQLMGTPASPPSLAGFVVGHAGLYQALAMFAVAYFIIGMTVLSVCAIATNGALDAGGAYCILCCGCCWVRTCRPKSGDNPAASECHAGAVALPGLGGRRGGTQWCFGLLASSLDSNKI